MGAGHPDPSQPGRRATFPLDPIATLAVSEQPIYLLTLILLGVIEGGGGVTFA